ncbi:type II toxin-antitoxin system prevent-host-death family antitoxin [bacterium]|nr:type II toxin-antitoxin system prevent-host-death family antitoxin [bacterium]
MVVSKGKLKAKMLEYFREVERTGEPLIVTDHGREVLEIRPLAKKPMTTKEVLAWYRSGPGAGILPSAAELMRPVPEEEWEVLREDDRKPW